MKKNCIIITFLLAISFNSQEIKFDRLIGNNDGVNYYLGHYHVPGSDGLEIKWYGGIRLTEGGYNNVLQLTNGNVGIGTITPKEKLDVNGSFRAGTDERYFIYNGSADILLKDISRGTGGRAIVHDGNNKLTLNYENDFTGGTQLGQSFLVKGTNAILDGKLEAKEIKITNTPTADFVFEKNYNLPTLESIEKHIKEKKHLPEVASAKEMQKEGVNIGDFQIKLLQKIEELTLYSIKQNKQLKQQTEINKKLEQRLSKLEKK
ncbi:hypothetical protein [Chryseobacterium sp. c4a]|uniref:hypothetical protein n=1 Tax=Chryseobacterium sp. c4a TaxID=1573582 RepID=UPI001356A54D|nr:hypothetical protein [Chryseobacterium sp. c4a]